MSEHHGKIWWSEHNSADPKAAAESYGALLGWDIQHTPMPEMDYYLGLCGGVPVAGFMALEAIPGEREIPPHWFTYIAVSDVDGAIAANAKAGGTTLREPFDVPQAGRIAIICDPSHAVIGLMTPAEMP